MAVFLGAIKKNKGKVKISFINEDGYKRIKYITPEVLAQISKMMNITIE